MSRRETNDPTGAPHFHYSRAERLGYDPATSGKKKPESIFKRNRSLAIILLDLAVILLVYVIYLVFLAPDASTARMNSYEFRLRAVQFGDDVLVTLAVQSLSEAGTPSREGEGILEVVLSDQDGTELVRLVEIPPEHGGERVFRQIISDYRPPRERGLIFADLQLGENGTRLQTSVSQE
jgi:hypothetical protein